MVPVHESILAIHQDGPCIAARPTSLPGLSRQLLRAFLAFVRHEARARVRTRDASAGYLDQKSTHARRHAESCLTAVLRTQRSLAGPASVIKPIQHSWSKANFKLIDGPRGLAGGAFWPPCVSTSGFEARICCLTHGFMRDD
jgi:hypothetical protein